ncbi:MAG: YfhO family protein [Bacteroidetes bacterium]|nr:YfhO family protein [Bacteroidota bacterium]
MARNNVFSSPLLTHLLLLLTAILAFMSVAFLENPLKYDLLDQAYPWKYFIGECLHNGHLPLWNPYQLLGSPIHADPQSSAWYPVVWIIGYIFGYDIYSVSIDFILHIFLAGAGMAWLIRSLGMRSDVAFLAGVSYMLGGFFVGNAQHFMWIISAAWIPFLFASFIRLSDTLEFRYVLILVLISLMFMTGGYPAFIVISLYFLLVLFTFYVVRLLIAKDYKKLARYVFLNFAGLILVILINSVVIVSWYILGGEMTRGDGVLLIQALFGPFSPGCFVSFLFPMGTVSSTWIFGTDMSMANGYMGLLMILGILGALVSRNSFRIWLFILWGFLMLGIAVGDALPLREFAYNHIPFMDFFRFPSLFRVFAITGFIVGASSFFHKWLETENNRIITLRIITVLVFTGILLTTVILYFRHDLYWTEFITRDLFTRAKDYTSAQYVLFQGLVQSILMLAVVVLVFRMPSAPRLFRMLILIAMIDMVLSVRFNGSYTAYAHNVSSRDMKEVTMGLPSGFPVPGTEPVKLNTDRGKSITPLWRNLHIFYKKIAWDGYNPLHLKGFEYLADSMPLLFEQSISHPPVFLAYKTLPQDSAIILEKKGNIPQDVLFLESDTQNQILTEYNPGDTVIYKSFGPNEFVVETRTGNPAYLTYLNNNYPGWQAEIDGKEASLMTSNFALMTVLVPGGTHEVTFRYHPGEVITALYVSLITLLLVLVGWIYFMVKGFRRNQR